MSILKPSINHPLLGGVAFSGAGSGLGTSFLGFVHKSSTSGVLPTALSAIFKVDLKTTCAVLSVLGTTASLIQSVRNIVPTISARFAAFFSVSITLTGNNLLYQNVLDWIVTEVLAPRGVQTQTATLQARQDSIQYRPVFNNTWFVLKQNVFLVQRENSTGTSLGTQRDERIGSNQRLEITCLGRSLKPIHDLFDTCCEYAEKKRKSQTSIYCTKDSLAPWAHVTLTATRRMETVYFEEDVKSELIADIQNYLDPKNRQFYAKRGIPYRRGYLLHGPPGTGKTSLATALAGHFGLGLFLVHLPSVRSDYSLDMLFSTLPASCIVLLEDIDAVGIERQPGGEDEENQYDSLRKRRADCSLSGLLNVLDGVGSATGRIVLMTSNFPEKLDEALIRPGRIDKQVYLGHTSQATARKMFLGIYAPDADSENPSSTASTIPLANNDLSELAATFSSQIPEAAFTPAQLMEYLISYRDSPADAAVNFSIWAEKQRMKKEEAAARMAKAKELKATRKANKKKTVGTRSGTNTPVESAFDMQEILMALSR